jgi:hypothetical protein
MLQAAAAAVTVLQAAVLLPMVAVLPGGNAGLSVDMLLLVGEAQGLDALGRGGRFFSCGRIWMAGPPTL